MTSRLGGAPLLQKEVDILASSYLRVRGNQAVALLAQADQRARRSKRVPQISGTSECRIEERVAKIGPFDLVLSTE
jgi:hypothetical protein